MRQTRILCLHDAELAAAAHRPACADRVTCSAGKDLHGTPCSLSCSYHHIRRRLSHGRQPDLVSGAARAGAIAGRIAGCASPNRPARGAGESRQGDRRRSGDGSLARAAHSRRREIHAGHDRSPPAGDRDDHSAEDPDGKREHEKTRHAHRRLAGRRDQHDEALAPSARAGDPVRACDAHARR
jgi:hypothetical protein